MQEQASFRNTGYSEGTWRIVCGYILVHVWVHFPTGPIPASSALSSVGFLEEKLSGFFCWQPVEQWATELLLAAARVKS